MCPSANLQIVDSHTGGEPTRVIVEGLPPLGPGSVAARCRVMREQADWIRTTLTHEPRGADWMVGAALLEPSERDFAAGVIFFNNVGYLGMCGHGLIGVVTTLAYQKRLSPGWHQFETTAGRVRAKLHKDGAVSIENVPSYRAYQGVSIQGPDQGPILGDIAYGGNWFFLTEVDDLDAGQIDLLSQRSIAILRAVQARAWNLDQGGIVDHVELMGPPSDPITADGRNFVMCPGGHYDRSPCGTGTSAKLACLAADGILAPGQIWRQESITGSRFEASYRLAGERIIPTIRGRAYVTGVTTVIVDPADPYRHGMRLPSRSGS